MVYDVTALRHGQELVLLDIDALDEARAAEEVRRRGLTPLTVRPRQRESKNSLWNSSPKFDLVQFSQELRSLLEAGITVVEAIATLDEKEATPETKTILGGITRSLREGRTLSSALEEMGNRFPPLYIATIRASERTGGLTEGLTRYITYAQQMGQLRARLVSASIYPAMLIGAGGLVVIFLLGYVIPRFSRIYADMGDRLPVLSRLLMYLGQGIEAWGGVLLVGIVVAAMLLWPRIRAQSLSHHLSAFVLRVPALREHARLYQLSRFYRTLGMLSRGGIPIPTAVGMVSGLLDSGHQARLSLALNRIREGQSISQAFFDQGLTTPVALRMLQVGEQSGQIGELMERIAAFYDEELARWIEWFTRLFEPLLMAVIGLVIGVVVVLMYLPIFELAGSLK